jgi:hypothetical protein
MIQRAAWGVALVAVWGAVLGCAAYAQGAPAVAAAATDSQAASIAASSPTLAIALALGYGAAQVAGIVKALTDKGITLRVTLSDEDRAALRGR